MSRSSSNEPGLTDLFRALGLRPVREATDGTGAPGSAELRPQAPDLPTLETPAPEAQGAGDAPADAGVDATDPTPDNLLPAVTVGEAAPADAERTCAGEAQFAAVTDRLRAEIDAIFTAALGAAELTEEPIPSNWIGPLSELRFAVNCTPLGSILQVEIPTRETIVLRTAFQDDRALRQYAQLLDTALAVARGSESVPEAIVSENAGGLHHVARLFEIMATQMDASITEVIGQQGPMADARDLLQIRKDIQTRKDSLRAISRRILDRIATATPPERYAFIEAIPANALPA